VGAAPVAITYIPPGRGRAGGALRVLLGGTRNPCTDAGQHYARFLRVYRRGILDATGLAAVGKAAAYITAGAIVPDA
jgi:hypothetical protein